MAIPPSSALPVIVVTGFLGSGKTTLVNRLLRDRPRSAVVMNEFGAVPVDQRLLEHHGSPLAVLSGGCLCCQVRASMAPLLRNLWMAWRERSHRPFDQVLIETSGVASPGPVLDTLLRDRWLAQRYRLLTVVTTIAAPSGAEQLDRFPEAESQVALADTLLITQGDLATRQDAAGLSSRLERLAPMTRRLSAHPDNLGFDAILPTTAGFSRRPAAPSDGVDHGFHSVSIRLSGPVLWESLQAALQRLLISRRDRLVRVKGLVQVPGSIGPLVVQGGAGRLHPPVPLSGQPDEDRQGRLVFITVGPVGDLLGELAELAAAGSAVIH